MINEEQLLIVGKALLEIEEHVEQLQTKYNNTSKFRLWKRCRLSKQILVACQKWFQLLRTLTQP
jgi:hypothetical protein